MYAASVLVQNDNLVDGKMETHMSTRDPAHCQQMQIKDDCAYNYEMILHFFQEPFNDDAKCFDSLQWLMNRVRSID